MAEGSFSATEMSESSSRAEDPVIRILLIGRKGSGKSSSGNTILGEKRFKVGLKHDAEIHEEVTQIRGKQVSVIECPDLLDPDLNEEQLEKMKEQLVSGCSAGLSSVLLTVPLEKPLQNEQEILDYIKCLFGPEVQKYIMILFTHECESDQTIAEPQTQHDHADLQRLMTECGGKFHCFNNRIKSDDQIQQLLMKIEGKMLENGGKFIMKQLKRSNSKANLVNFSEESPAADPDL
ncbi:immune-associated nucleotide-binding protein 9-like [Carassius auratus]|uniref:Immune-associated nucleotide-binding protein 9-like n=1 Tax=Carassius auratus TaxID=7957 RepID=A0A6P6PEP6_CARAU|nr:immune-associated nucleotide-binding protein 9-like [Carassius auratus]